jgi:hypothetical protein
MKWSRDQIGAFNIRTGTSYNQALLLIILGILAVVLPLAFFFGRHSVPIAGFDNIAVGMTEAQVKITLAGC